MWSRGLRRLHCLRLLCFLMFYEGGRSQPILSLKQEGDIFEGDSVTFDCQAGDPDAWQYLWLRDGTNLHESWDNSSTQMIKRVTLADRGSYRCYIKRKADPIEELYSNTIELQVSERPAAEITSVRGWSDVFKNERLVLQCTGDKKYNDWSYRWYKNGEELQEGHGNGTAKGNTWSIDLINESHGGTYVCRGERSRRPTYTQRSKPFNVTVRDRPMLFLTMRPAWQTVYYGEMVTLSCQMIAHIPGLQYQWYKDGDRLQAPYPIGHRVESHIYSISSVARSDQGEYKCQAYSGRPSVQLYASDPLMLKLTEHPEVSLEWTPMWTVLFAGEDVTFSCRVEGDSQMKTFRWFVAAANNSKQTLSCENTPSCPVTFSDKNQSGLYWCETELGERRSKAVDFTVTADMVALQTPPLPLTEGDNVTFGCRTQNPTKYTAKVFHEDQEMLPSGGYFPVEKEHEGRYKCAVFSDQTLLNSSEELHIPVRDFFSSVTLSVFPGLFVSEGQTVNLTCEALKNSFLDLPVNYSFLHEGVLISAGTDAVYSLSNVKMNSFGTYSCIASSEHGIAKESAVLKIRLARDWSPIIRYAIGSVLLLCLIGVMTLIHIRTTEASDASLVVNPRRTPA
ncbi:B-cell receptor CD22-like [Polypterus senegalus]|uniref:B-cell receptor CD22-like n=1 Tax=Polypterus senegalus TaxID=55291 RepID=UPI0019657E92|nr:B-cell receptor CD22-like [Polypterus senegalus]